MLLLLCFDFCRSPDSTYCIPFQTPEPRPDLLTWPAPPPHSHSQIAKSGGRPDSCISAYRHAKLELIVLADSHLQAVTGVGTPCRCSGAVQLSLLVSWMLREEMRKAFHPTHGGFHIVRLHGEAEGGRRRGWLE